MNELQRAAYVEGHNLIAVAFQSRKNLDMPTLTHWINSCQANALDVEKTVQLHDRNDEGDLVRTTTTKAGKAELCGYRLMGAFNAVEFVRAHLDAKGVTFNGKTTT